MQKKGGVRASAPPINLPMQIVNEKIRFKGGPTLAGLNRDRISMWCPSVAVVGILSVRPFSLSTYH